MRWMRLVAAGAMAALTITCGDDGPPTPPTLPTTGEPNATALANLALVERLERASGRSTLLAAVSARVERSGRVTPGESWHYTFLQPSDPTVVTQWRVSSGGSITSDTYGSCGFSQPVDMASLAGLDSDRIVALALAYGAAALLDRVGEPKALTVSYISGIVRVRVEAPDCYFLHNGIEMDPVTGRLLRADVSCTGTPMRPCVMPGVF
jgi:hypothetical protein